MSRRAVLFWATALLLMGADPRACMSLGRSAPAGAATGQRDAVAAGFARVDITPPPGVGLAATARGRRGARLPAPTLCARARVGRRRRQPRGARRRRSRLSSTLLHRRVAALTARTDGIGVDRLVIAVTHTHAGPGHYFEAAGYNDAGSSVLATTRDGGFAHGAHCASSSCRGGDLRPARVAWGSRAVWGETRIRSLPAILRNIPLPTAPADAPAGLPQNTGSSIRSSPCCASICATPRAARSGPPRVQHLRDARTGNAPSNDLLDPDIQGLVERRLSGTSTGISIV